MKWTSEQEFAIQDRDHTLLVAAAAGSGKTAVLIERIATLILGGIDVEQMLILTFTNAAAAEMRERLISRLESEAESVRKSNPELAARMDEQARKCPRAQIKTLHSFCQWLLQRAFELVDIDPGFRICDAEEGKILKLRALEDTLVAAYNQLEAGETEAQTHPSQRTDAMFAANLRRLDELRGPDKVGQLVLRLHNFLESRPDPEAWLDAQITYEPWDAQVRELESRTDMLLLRSRDMIVSALNVANGEISPDDAPQYSLALEQDAAEWPQPGDKELLLAYKPPRFQASGSRRKETKTLGAELVKKLRDQAKKLLAEAQALAKLDTQAELERQLENIPALNALCELVRRFTAAYEARKRERSALDFSDLEHLALKALRAGVADEFRTRFKYVFVDEYQDISLVQESILALLSRADNQFMVGDVKQSIYRFRQAEPGLFISKYGQFAAPNTPGAQSLRLDLNRNFRSSVNVINFVNAVFELNMHADEYEIEYDAAARLIPGRDDAGSDAPVEIHLFSAPDANAKQNDNLDLDSDEPDVNNATLATMERLEQESELVSERIHELLGTPFFDSKTGMQRTVTPRDIVVLSRKLAGVAQITLDVLTRNGIPAYADAARGYFAVYEVRQALALLRVVENRHRDYDLLAVMRSPMYGFKTAELAQLRANHTRTAGRSGARASFYDAVRAESEQDTPLGRRAAALLGDVVRWQRDSLELPLATLFWQVMDETGFYAYAGALPGGMRRQSNLNLLAERAAAYEQNQFGGLHGFLQYISQLQHEEQDLGAASTLGEADNVVRIMSIHKSKGLEFPIVIALNLGTSPHSATDSDMMCHSELGLGLAFMDEERSAKYTTLSQRAISSRLTRDQLAEELRVLYVMLTRARERLILIGSVEGSAESKLTLWRTGVPPRVRSMLDWLMPVVVYCAAHEAMPGIPKVNLSCHDLGGEAAATHYVSFDKALARLNAQPVDQNVLRRLSWQYPHADAVYAPLKLTVSQLHREYEGPIHLPERRERPAFMEEQGLTAREAGVATHSFMQWLDLAPLAERARAAALAGTSARMLIEVELHRQLQALTGRGTLTPARAESVRLGDVSAFLCSDTGLKLLSAKQVRREWAFNLRVYSDDILPGDDKPVANANAHERLLVQGVIDCCFEVSANDQPGWYLLDYKTGHLHASSPDEVRAAYASQLRLYALALERITGWPVVYMGVYMLKARQLVEVARDEVDSTHVLNDDGMLK